MKTESIVSQDHSEPAADGRLVGVEGTVTGTEMGMVEDATLLVVGMAELGTVGGAVPGVLRPLAVPSSFVKLDSPPLAYLPLGHMTSGGYLWLFLLPE